MVDEGCVLARDGVVQREDLRKGRVPSNYPQPPLVEARARQQRAATPRLEIEGLARAQVWEARPVP